MMLPRRKIWQLDARMHCSVLGTCLPLGELFSLARRARYQLDDGISAYALHSAVVDLMPYPNELSRLIDKELERRHRLAANKILRARSEEEIELLWKEVSARGEMAGAYWAAMSHPLCSITLAWRLFGDVHMLSHLLGASRSSEIFRLHDLEVRCGDLDLRLSRAKQAHHVALKERRSVEQELAAQGSQLERTERLLASARSKIAVPAPGVEARVAALEADLAAMRARAVGAEAELAKTRGQLDEAVVGAAHAREQVAELVAENNALEREVMNGSVFAAQSDDEERPGLRGKRILCVGGRSNLVQHYRVLVERRGGELVHHDGGVEESLSTVTRAMSTVDAVVCSIDCVSHAACLKVKRACKHLAKQFVPLRSSGLSSFARGIDAIGER